MSNDPFDLAGQEKDEAARKAKQQIVTHQEIEDFKWLMADKRGRRFMWRLLSVTGLFRNPFTGNSETFYRCGEMGVGQRFFADINLHCPEKYEIMVKEQTSK